MTNRSNFRKPERKKVDAYVQGRTAWEEQRPFDPPQDDVGRIKYRQGYEDAVERSKGKGDA